MDDMILRQWILRGLIVLIFVPIFREFIFHCLFFGPVKYFLYAVHLT